MFSFTAFLERLVEVGNLTLIDAKGNTHHFGDGTGPAVTIRVKSPAVYRRILLNPSMGLGESYMDGLVDIEQGTIREFLDIAVFNYARMESSGRTPAHAVMAAQRAEFRSPAQPPPSCAPQRGASL